MIVGFLFVDIDRVGEWVRERLLGDFFAEIVFLGFFWEI